MNGMTVRRIALGFAAAPPLPAALWAFSLWRDHGGQGIAALGETVVGVLPGAYLAMAVVGLPVFLLAGRMGGWIAHLVMGIFAVWAVELSYLSLMGLLGGGLPAAKLPSVFAVVVADAVTHAIGSLLLPAIFGALAGLIFWALTRTKSEPFQGRFG
jgi:hypothetical protein